jgi:O-acetyl-ADP-ribose deacetylase (regulator of RNase III)
VVALPAVSAGLYRGPAEDAARVALSAVRSATCAVQEARFVLYTEEMRDVFATVLGRVP